MLENRRSLKGLSRQKVAVLASWFVLLVGMRVLLGLALEDLWAGTLGAVVLTFAVFYALLRYTPLRRYRQLTNAVLISWYRKKFFYISGAASLVLLGSILGLIQYGHERFSDRLVAVDLAGQEVEESLRLLAANEELKGRLAENLEAYSPLDIMAITLASTDLTFHGYYVKFISYVFAENVEIMVFLLFFRTREDMFAFPSYLSRKKKEASMSAEGKREEDSGGGDRQGDPIPSQAGSSVITGSRDEQVVKPAHATVAMAEATTVAAAESKRQQQPHEKRASLQQRHSD